MSHTLLRPAEGELLFTAFRDRRHGAHVHRGHQRQFHTVADRLIDLWADLRTQWLLTVVWPMQLACISISTKTPHVCEAQVPRLRCRLQVLCKNKRVYSMCKVHTLAALVMVPAVSIMSSTSTATLSFTSPIRFITSETLCEERLLSTIAKGASFSCKWVTHLQRCLHQQQASHICCTHALPLSFSQHTLLMSTLNLHLHEQQTQAETSSTQSQ